MKKFFANPWLWRILGAILIGLLIWFVGPLIAIGGWSPLAWWPVTLVFALLPALCLLGWWFFARRREARKNAALVEALAPPAAADSDELSAKLREALTMLKSTKLGKRGAYVYQLPWYAIIGPSGAGKTTALLNAGLNFPTAVAGEYRALRGQPKTPNCDWWFTDEAVLIDTAGRYVSQDDNAAADAEGWKGFLNLLKTHRPLQPLNGVIVAIPAPDFADSRKMASHSENIRARLAEITQTLGQDLPIYVLVTKADLLAGFREYFARAGDSESDQVFGTTAPGEGADNANVMQGFDALVSSVAGRVVDRMQNEPELVRRAQVAAFPAQLASLRGPINELLTALGQKSRFDAPARVRGLYFASGTQTGNPVDRILLTAGVPATASASAVGMGRSFFLKRFFSDLVIPEQGLAGRNALAERGQKRRYMGGIAAGITALVVAVGLWSWGYVRNSALITNVYATAASYGQAAGASQGGTSTPEQDIAALDVLGKATGDAEKASDFGLGLGQGGRLFDEMTAIYGRDLQRRLTPILAGLAEDRLAVDAAAPAALYDDLKSYLILGGRGPTQVDQLLGWVQSAWTAKTSDDAGAGNVARHTAALLAGSFKPVGVDTARIENARNFLRTQPASVRVYGRLKSKALEKGDAMWTARENAGPRPEAFFASSGAFATGAGVPALFTRAGYDKTFLPILSSGPALLEEERWVVGDTGAATSMDAGQMAALKRDLERLYFDEFLNRWRAYFAAMQPRAVTSLADNVQRLRDGSGPLSPIAPLLRAAAQVTNMTPAKGAKLPAMPGGALGKQLLGASGLAGTGDDPRRTAVAEFLPLRLFVGIPATGGPPPPGAPAPIDAMLTTMGQLADKLNIISVLPGGGGEQGSQASLEVRALLAQLDQQSNSMPAPAGLLLKSVTGDANVALGGARASQMNSALDASFGESCVAAVSKSFPVQPAAQAEMTIADFGHFFSPKGAFQKFVGQELAGYIDTTTPEWVAKANAAEIGLTESDVRALQAAYLVTRTFFASDPEAPRLTYQIEPVALAGAKAVSLQIDGQSLNYDGKAPVPGTFDWPGAGEAKLQFTVEGSTAPEIRTWPGAWAAFRMMRAAAIKSAGTPVIGTGSLTQGGARFDFRIRTFGSANPFVIDPFVKIACPATRGAPVTG